MGEKESEEMLLSVIFCTRRVGAASYNNGMQVGSVRELTGRYNSVL